MAPPDTEAAQAPIPEDVMRRVAREEARAVYDDYTVTDDDGKQWTFPEVVESISELEGGTTRRTMVKAAMAMGYIAMGGAGTTAIMRAVSQPAAAAAVGETGTSSDPLLKLYAAEILGGSAAPIDLGDAVTFDHEAVSSATTIGNTTYVYYDSSVAGFTITIPASLESRGGFLVFIDEGASVASNNVDITSTNWTVDGVNNSTVDANQSVYKLAANPSQSDWTSRIFTQTVDARQVDIGDFAAVLSKTSDQATSADTDTTVDWDSQDVDTGAFTYSTADDDIDVLQAGDYRVDAYARITSITDGDVSQYKVFVNNVEQRQIGSIAASTEDRWGGSVLLKDLSANDTIRLDLRTGTNGTISGVSTVTWAMISKEA